MVSTRIATLTFCCSLPVTNNHPLYKCDLELAPGTPPATLSLFAGGRGFVRLLSRRCERKAG